MYLPQNPLTMVYSDVSSQPGTAPYFLPDHFFAPPPFPPFFSFFFFCSGFMVAK